MTANEWTTSYSMFMEDTSITIFVFPMGDDWMYEIRGHASLPEYRTADEAKEAALKKYNEDYLGTGE